MKKLLVLITAIISIAVNVNAQNKTLTTDNVFTAKGAAGDTIVQSGTPITYTIYVKDWCENILLGVESDSVRDSQNSRTIISASLDNVNFSNLDTVDITTNGNNVLGLSDYITVRRPYVKITTSKITNAGTARIKYYVLINKND